MKPLFSKPNLRLLAVLVYVCFGETWCEAAEPIALHPDNPHYFIWKGEPTLLITSGEHYGALLNLDFDYERYFDELQANDLNHTRVFAGTYREIESSFGITDNPLAPKPMRYIAPWARSKQPGYADGGNKFDLNKWDEHYFDRLRNLMQAARQRGIVVELTLFCPMYRDELWEVCPMNERNNVNGVGNCPREEVFTLKHEPLTRVQLAVTRKIVQELRDFDNLYYEVCNEPYFGGVTQDWQHQIVEAIVEAEKDFPAQHLISLNVANGRKKIENPHPAVSIFNFHYCVPPDTVTMNYGLNKVIGENETGFRGKDDLLYRTEGWDFLMAGGALYNNLDYSFTTKHPDGSFTEYRSPGGGSPALRAQLQILRNFFVELDFVDMQPQPDVVRSVSPELTCSGLVQADQVWAIYAHVPLPNKPRDIQAHQQEDIRMELKLELPAGRFSGYWLDTKSGKQTDIPEFEHGGGVCSLNSPAFDNDIALRINRRP